MRWIPKPVSPVASPSDDSVAERRRTLLRDLLRAKFGRLPKWADQRLEAATPEQAELLDEHCALLASLSPQSRRLSRDQTLALVPVLRPERLLGSALEPDASDIDVHALHQGYLRGLRRHGGTLVCDAEVTHIERHGGAWRVMAGGQEYRAPLLVNAAGAWCDGVARMASVRPIGLQPKRRSAFIFAPPPGLDVTRWPSVVDADETWYFKPDAGMLLGSPANADPVAPQDVQRLGRLEHVEVALAAVAHVRSIFPNGLPSADLRSSDEPLMGGPADGDD